MENRGIPVDTTKSSLAAALRAASWIRSACSWVYGFRDCCLPLRKHNMIGSQNVTKLFTNHIM